MTDRLLYASDAEDNHEDPWADGWDPARCDAATGARKYAEEHGLGAGDHVYVIEASEADRADTDDPEEHGWPLVVHQTWHFIVVAETDDSITVEEVPHAD